MLDNTNATPATEAQVTPAVSDEPASTPATPESTPAQSEDEFLSTVYKQAMTETEEKPPADEKAEPEQVTRERDEKGRFLGKNTEIPADPAAPKDEKADAPEATQKEEEPEGDRPTDEKRNGGGEFRGWSKEEREAFRALPAAAQEFVLNRQRAVTGFYSQKVNELSNFARAASPFVEVIDRYGDYLDAVSADLGVQPQHVISNLMQAEATLRYGSFQDKARILQQMAEDYGVPLRMAEADPLADPIAPGGERYAEVHDLKQQVAQLTAQLQAQHRQQTIYQQNAIQQSLVAEMDHFRGAKDQAGQPLYPYFEQVRPHMGAFLASGAAQSLESAYQMATAPIRHAVDRAVTARSHVTEARQAGRINVTTAPTSVERYATEDEALSAAYRRATAQ